MAAGVGLGLPVESAGTVGVGVCPPVGAGVSSSGVDSPVASGAVGFGEEEGDSGVIRVVGGGAAGAAGGEVGAGVTGAAVMGGSVVGDKVVADGVVGAGVEVGEGVIGSAGVEAGASVVGSELAEGAGVSSVTARVEGAGVVVMDSVGDGSVGPSGASGASGTSLSTTSGAVGAGEAAASLAVGRGGPSLQVPVAESHHNPSAHESGRHISTLQSSPECPKKQWQTPSSQTPFPLQSPGQPRVLHMAALSGHGPRDPDR